MGPALGTLSDLALMYLFHLHPLQYPLQQTGEGKWVVYNKLVKVNGVCSQVW